MNRVPICSGYCNDWFDACKDDMTCVQNWLSGFNYSTNVNTCPAQSTCRKFSEVMKITSIFFVVHMLALR